MSNPTEIVKSFYAALDRGDISSALATLHDELEWTEAERAPYYTGTWHSPEEVCEKLFVPLSRDWEDTRGDGLIEEFVRQSHLSPDVLSTNFSSYPRTFNSLPIGR